MAYADELRATFAGAQLGEPLGDVGRGEVDPAHDAGDEVGVRGGREEFARLVEARARLHEDRPAHSVRLEQRAQILGAERSADRGELVGQPGIRRAGRVPEVMVRVDEHGALHQAPRQAGPSGKAYSRSDSGFMVTLYPGRRGGR